MEEGKRKLYVALGIIGAWMVIAGVGIGFKVMTGEMIVDASKAIFGLALGLFVAGNAIEHITTAMNKNGGKK